MQHLFEQIQPMIEELEVIINDPDSDPYLFDRAVRAMLPPIKGSLELIQDCLQQKPLDVVRCYQYTKGLGRLSIEYIDFADSNLGNRVGLFHDDLMRELGSLLNK